MSNPDFSDRFREALDSEDSLVEAAVSRDPVTTFAESVARGLGAARKSLDCRFLYDAEGSRLFEEITAQPEYYPTRTEAEILERHAGEIHAMTGPVTLVELGSGYSVKTEHLLSAYAGDDARYVPVDVSAGALRAAEQSIGDSFPEVNFTGIRGTYASAFRVLRELSPQMLVFLGSTIGNFEAHERRAFWHDVQAHLPLGDWFLLGADLVKDRDTLLAAYDDAAGVTAHFTKNYFARMNRELDSGVDLGSVEHRAVWNDSLDRIEIYAEFTSAQAIRVAPLGRSFDVGEGERIRVEVSQKFRLPELTEELERFGLEARSSFTDDRGWFGLLLLQRVREHASS
ncbi:MAG: L-histidine N(alpha)-methyltransferase [Planctomycetes bacterium]|nr:L-histidine N(alpha)-methyltransferase [Planctomycetota bacterium]